MKKYLKIIMVSLVIFSFSTLSACALDADFYEQQYESSGADALQEELPENAKEIFEDFDINAKDTSWLKDFDAKNIFGIISEFLKNGYKGPLAVFCSLMGVVLLCSAVNGMGDMRLVTDGTIDFIATLAVAAVVLAPLHTTVEACINAIRANGSFMLSFVPIFTAVVAANGQAATSAASGAVLLFAAEIMVSVIAFIIMPLCSCYLAVSLCASSNPIVSRSEIAGYMQKATNWILGLALTVFLGVLSVQTSISSAADTVSARTIKFAVGSAVPIVGASVSEALGTVKSCLSMLKTSVGIYGVIAAGVILLPIVLELVLWRFAMAGSCIVSDIFGCKKITALIKSVDSVLAILLGIVLYCVILFVIALTVVTKAGG